MFWTAVGTACILAMIRIYGFLEGTRFYFAFRHLATRASEDTSVFGLLVTLSIPLASGFGLTYAARRPVVGPATGAGFLAALLQSWPILFFSELRPSLVPPWLVGQPVKLFVLHGLYIGSYSMISRMGALLGVLALSQRPWFSSAPRHESAIRNILIGLIVAAVWQVLVSFWR